MVEMVRVLGPFGAVVGGAEADLGGPRQRAVLGRLVVAAGHVVSTDRLIDDLWDAGDVPAKALAVLQVHVSHLRRALEPGRARRAPATVLVSAAPGYALRLPAAAVDAWHAEELIRRAADAPPDEAHRLLTEALAAWSGQPYAEVADEDWARPEVVRLTELRLAAIEARAEKDLALGRPATVVADLERHLHDHPGREDAVRLLALALYRNGRQGDALAVLRRSREHLADELGIDPGPAVRALEEDILRQSPTLESTPAPVTVAGPVTPRNTGRRIETALGRTAEMATLAAAADQADRDGAKLVWIGGEAGGGKTTLAEAALTALSDRGWRVARGRCPEVEGAPPGWAWSEVVSVDVEGPPNPFRLGRAIAAELAGDRVAVLLDDAHRADDLTLQLLRQVISQLAAKPLLVVATYRVTEVGDELAATIGALLTATAAHLRLDGLDPAAVAALAAENGVADAPPDVLAMLAERTGGNPLFVRELARLIAAEGPGAAGTAVPTGVREVLRRRVARLPDGATIALRQAAVLGREVDVDVLAEVARRDADDLLDVLEIAVLAGLLDEPAPGRVRFTHALVRDTLYEDTPLLRRARLHTSALGVLESRRADAATLARHAVAAAGPATAHEAIPYATAAAREAAPLGAWGESARQWRTALRLHGTASRDAGAELDLLVPTITALARAGDTIGARAAYLRAVRITPTTEVLTAWDAPLIWTTRDGRDPDPVAHQALQEALAAHHDDATRARLLIALFREIEGYDVATAIRISGEALDLARTIGDERLRCAALNARAYAALGPDLHDDRRAIAEEYLRAAVGQVDHEAVAHWLLFLECSSRTDLTGALAEMGLAVERSNIGQLGGLLAVVGIFTGLLDIMAGRLDQALARYTEVARALDEHGAMSGALMAMVGRIGIAFHRGDLSPLRAELEAIEAIYPGRVTDPLALALADEGRMDDARRVWAARMPADRDYYWLGFTALRAHAAARLGSFDEAGRVYTELLPYAGRIAGADSGTLYAGPVDSALSVLAAALGKPDVAAAHAKAAAHLTEQVAAALAAH